MVRVVVLLCGPPGSGKTTAARASGLAIFDRDDPQWSSESEFKSAIRQLAGQPAARAVVIRSGATSAARKAAAEAIGATHVRIMPTLDQRTLDQRIAHRGRSDTRACIAGVRKWNREHDRHDGVAEFDGWGELQLLDAQPRRPQLAHITVISHGAKRQPPATRTIDCRHLPNPYDVPSLRPLDGRSHRVADWVLSHPQTQELLDVEVRQVPDRPVTIGVMCSAGHHRSVAVAIELGRRLADLGHRVTVTHQELATMSTPDRKPTTTELGLGWRHQQQLASLKANHLDGTPCWWCGQPMFLDADRNPDRKTLSGDHSRSRAQGGTETDRLLHADCNSARGDGSRDDARPALTGLAGGLPASVLGVRRLPWPF